MPLASWRPGCMAAMLGAVGAARGAAPSRGASLSPISLALPHLPALLSPTLVHPPPTSASRPRREPLRGAVPRRLPPAAGRARRGGARRWGALLRTRLGLCHAPSGHAAALLPHCPLAPRSAPAYCLPCPVQRCHPLLVPSLTSAARPTHPQPLPRPALSITSAGPALPAPSPSRSAGRTWRWA